jgi:hypothetical protein
MQISWDYPFKKIIPVTQQFISLFLTFWLALQLGSEPEPNINSSQSRTHVNIMRLQCWDSDPVRSEYLAGSTSGNFWPDLYLATFRMLKGRMSWDFLPKIFPEVGFATGSGFSRGRIHLYLLKMDRIWKNCGSATLKINFLHNVYFLKNALAE